MPRIAHLLICAFFLIGCNNSADVIIRGGTIYTGASPPKVEAILVKNQRIVFAGDLFKAQKSVGAETRVIDLHGAFAYPGFIDSHVHLSSIGSVERKLDLSSTKNTNLEDFLLEVKEAVDRTPDGQWITGRGWIESEWPKPVFPTRWDLDKISPRHPVFLTRADGHAAVANSLALKLAGIGRETKAPMGGEILLDPETGEPNGIFVDAALELVRKYIPPKSEDEKVKDLEAGIAREVALGWTSVHWAGSDFAEVERLKKMYDARRVNLRVYLAIFGPSADATRLLKEGPQVGLYDDHLTVRSIKVSIDGALGSRGAWLLEKYSDRNSFGLSTEKLDGVQALVEEALRSGIQVMTHAIGDRANREILNIYEAALKHVPAVNRKTADPRLRIEHAQILHPKDIHRLAALGVIPSMQPSHAITDLHFAPSRLGYSRLAGAYAWRTLIDSGTKIAGGSDAPIEKGDPRIEFYAAVARRDLKGFQGKGWHPEQRVTREEALKMFTLWPAIAAFQERDLGTLEAGKWADLTVLSKDIMTVPEREILKAETVLTVVGGQGHAL